MAVLAIRGEGDPREVLDAFASTTREASDYLANEVMNRLPADLAGFLTSISVLDEFDAPLCEAVSGQDHARQLLDRVVADDLFIYRGFPHRFSDPRIERFPSEFAPPPATPSLAVGPIQRSSR